MRSDETNEYKPNFRLWTEARRFLNFRVKPWLGPHFGKACAIDTQKRVVGLYNSLKTNGRGTSVGVITFSGTTHVTH